MLKKWYQNRDNIHLLILIKFLTALYFYLPYMTLYFLGRGLNLIQINSVWGIVVLTMFLTEVPTGILADRFSRRRAVQAAIFLQLVGEVLFLFVRTYWLLVVDAVIAGLGFAFGSGALEALIYDQLKSENRADQMKSVMGKLSAASYMGFVLSFGVSGLLIPQASQVHIRAAILMTCITVGLGFLVTLLLKPENYPEERFEVQHYPAKILKDGFRLLRRHRKLQRLVLLSTLSIAFWDYLGSLYQPYFQQIGVPDGWFGLTMAAASLAAFFAARSVHHLEEKLGPTLSLLFATVGPGLIYFILTINQQPWIGIAAVVLFRGLNALKAPLFADYQNRLMASHYRATLLSLISMIAGGYTAVLGVIIGAIAERSLSAAFLFCGLVVVGASLIFRMKKSSLEA